jgi:succinate-semialdehyde dehydrogenase / glutarate-semialdehyde dehydrogenase
MDFSPEGSKAIPLWINGHAFLTVNDAFHEIINPVTGEAVHRVPLCGAFEAQEVVNAARLAQPSWAEMGMQARRVCLGRLADSLENYAGHFAKLLMAETGFDAARADAEVAIAIEALRAATVGETGVIALVIDATRPLAGLVEALAPALMAGATVVIKPSIKAPSVAYALCELTARAEWPAGVVNLMHGDAAAIDGLCAAAVDRLVYSGEAVLGAKIGAMAALRAIPFELLVA